MSLDAPDPTEKGSEGSSPRTDGHGRRVFEAIAHSDTESVSELGLGLACAGGVDGWVGGEPQAGGPTGCRGWGHWGPGPHVRVSGPGAWTHTGTEAGHADFLCPHRGPCLASLRSPDLPGPMRCPRVSFSRTAGTAPAEVRLGASEVFSARC